ncbi:neuropilin-2-like [Argopecten irradians]|uniref:neuropilin-2-like n=1 Tax=Argopecten irradians TaxID=31199 RepID=UPI0037112A00
MRSQLLLAIQILMLTRNGDCCCGEKLINGPRGIANASLTASSAFQDGCCFPKYSRIGNVHPYAWCPFTASKTEYLQVTLNCLTILKAIIIQGRTGVQYITSFTAFTSVDGVGWKALRDSTGSIEIFTANNDGTSLVTRPVHQTSPTKFVRIHPETWRGWPACRLELLGVPVTANWEGKIGVPDEVPPTLQQLTAPNNALCGTACHKSGSSCGSFMYDFETNECHLFSAKTFNITASVSASRKKIYYVDNYKPECIP